jgi:hypothetical protein
MVPLASPSMDAAMLSWHRGWTQPWDYGYGVGAALLAAGSATWSSPTEFSPVGILAGSAIARHGNAAVAWTERMGTDDVLKAAIYSPAAAAWSRPPDVSNVSPNSAICRESGRPDGSRDRHYARNNPGRCRPPVYSIGVWPAGSFRSAGRGRHNRHRHRRPRVADNS